MLRIVAPLEHGSPSSMAAVALQDSLRGPWHEGAPHCARDQAGVLGLRRALGVCQGRSDVHA